MDFQGHRFISPTNNRPRTPAGMSLILFGIYRKDNNNIWFCAFINFICGCANRLVARLTIYRVVLPLAISRQANAQTDQWSPDIRQYFQNRKISEIPLRKLRKYY